MVTDKQTLFQIAMQRWPNKICISDKLPSKDSVATVPSLADIYRCIESEISENDDWDHIAAWSFHQALNEIAMMRRTERHQEVCPEQVPFELFDNMMTSNLADESWTQERDIYAHLPLASA